jgi:hypothetical protein
MSKITTGTVEMHLDANDILHIRVLPDAEFTIGNTKLDREESLKLTGDRKVKVLIDGNPNFTVTEEGMAYAATPEANANRKAVAFVSSSIASALNANFFHKCAKPVVPYAVFKTREEALEWLGQW